MQFRWNHFIGGMMKMRSQSSHQFANLAFMMLFGNFYFRTISCRTVALRRRVRSDGPCWMDMTTSVFATNGRNLFGRRTAIGFAVGSCGARVVATWNKVKGLTRENDETIDDYNRPSHRSRTLKPHTTPQKLSAQGLDFSPNFSSHSD